MSSRIKQLATKALAVAVLGPIVSLFALPAKIFAGVKSVSQDEFTARSGVASDGNCGGCTACLGTERSARRNH